MSRKVKCDKCGISMIRIEDCGSSPDGTCGVWKCSQCQSSVHSHRGSKQNTLRRESEV